MIWGGVKKVAVLLCIALALAAFGFVFGFLAAFLGSYLIGGNEYGYFGNLVGAIAGMVIGYPLGIAAGIALLDKVLRYRGWILAGIVGAVLGGVLPVAFAELMNINGNPDLLWALILLLPPLLGVAGFCIPKPKSYSWRRRPDSNR